MKKLIKTYFKILSAIAPRLAGKQAFELFQRPLNKKIRQKDKALYQYATEFSIPYHLENIQAFELGPKEGALLIMVHGWESNAGSFSEMAFKLAEAGNRVILFNLPAHGYSKLKKFNLKIGREVFEKVIEYVNPDQNIFSIVSHSFGSAITAYTLSKNEYQIDQLVFLTSPNKLTEIFDDYAYFIGLNKMARRILKNRATELLEEDLNELSIEKLGEKSNYNKLLMIHDIEDKIIPISKSLAIQHQWSESDIFMVDGSGHYRMLWDSTVIKKVVDNFKPKVNSERDKQYAIAV